MKRQRRNGVHRGSPARGSIGACDTHLHKMNGFLLLTLTTLFSSGWGMEQSSGRKATSVPSVFTPPPPRETRTCPGAPLLFSVAVSCAWETNPYNIRPLTNKACRELCHKSFLFVHKQVPSRCTVTQVKFRNSATESTTLYWVSETMISYPVATLQPGESTVQQTVRANPNRNAT